MTDYNRGIELDPGLVIAYNDRAMAYFDKHARRGADATRSP